MNFRKTFNIVGLSSMAFLMASCGRQEKLPAHIDWDEDFSVSACTADAEKITVPIYILGHSDTYVSERRTRKLITASTLLKKDLTMSFKKQIHQMNKTDLLKGKNMTDMLVMAAPSNLESFLDDAQNSANQRYQRQVQKFFGEKAQIHTTVYFAKPEYFEHDPDCMNNII